MIRIDAKQILDLLKQLVRTPSVNPAIDHSQDEGAIADLIAKWFRKTGRFSVYEQKVAKGRFNVVAILRGTRRGRSLMLNGHMDTVGTVGMTVKPFTPSIVNGKLFGRGSCDMKGSIAAMIGAMAALSASNRKLAGDVLFTGVVDEEYMSIGTSELIKRFRADAAIVGEPTNMNIGVAHKGYAWLEVETIGKPAHGSMPEKGIDAIEKMALLINLLGSIRRKYNLNRHPLLGVASIHTSTITGGSDWSTVPARCVLDLERRLLPGENPQDPVEELRKAIKVCSRRDKSLKATVRLIHHADPMQINDAPHISILKKNLSGLGRIVGVPYWTDGSILWNQAEIPTCLFGPGDIAVAHGPAEHVKIEDVLRAARVYAETAAAYCIA
ncbi:MAG: ArgE/DapE family deacylase [Candidatus Bathyarchaeia archaeon]